MWHWQKAVEQWNELKPLTHRRCPNCQQVSVQSTMLSAAMFCTNPACMRVLLDDGREAAELVALNRAVPTPAQRARVDLVYYLRWANRIKIGTTTNLTSRLASVYNDECMAVEPGGVAVEKRRHAQFAASRIPNQSEWFSASPELLNHIKQMRIAHGEPLATANRLYRAALVA